ncbi:Iron-sulfur cluster insertion protein ErpA [Methanimicrococcus hongohii]|uniref:Iron-sulfur cluster insertion protein ErpA n=1 Tax=Methanimicrococcus hongohii TaxID=3028295 RepID=A0AA96ZV33_9EURY|nr:iron-sulfur cluster assembly accessory protein [Methanimicrococcus sp. Hf6]WNY24412.1 Iron-sulfur cluster insertion protein ErpA [Methanimicrococcus sp. Hf6]
MVTITDAAVAALNDVLEEQNKKDHYLRVFIAGIGCSGPSFGLALEDKVNETDKTTEVGATKVIYDVELEKTVENLVIDYIDNEMGTGFVIEDPTAEPCGGGCAGCH